MPTKRSYTDHGDGCATAHAMELIGDRWTYPILRELMLAPKRFNELAEGVRGVTPAVLTSRLRELETAGLIDRATLPAPARATAYQVSAWGQQLRPVFESLGRWAQASPTWHPAESGLTPDAAVQSMLTMAPRSGLTTPAVLELRLHDERHDTARPYDYRLQWATELAIVRGPAPDAQALVSGDSSTWVGVLYEGVPLEQMQISGDAAAVERVVSAFAS
ncbi:helix-turn-helix transcriptional regulator [Salinibacterium sp. SYSU T00001]|uniref:winged helix-turn-helix transcriptional regulator n=1 Tax=Homoserinimonas sedimenticola TaxID=2986805 RepID=UPI0022362537|nr:helix-turn-helix domain-containing protein [Salinibacterium sedimenticola]MCW4386164.1 helix-turn-helix transcriptional regulator [Salinibacterium sedimenticola]